jgi:hypothetical protein
MVPALVAALALVAAAPPFVGRSAPVTARELPHSWHRGCPVGPEQLRKLSLSYWDFAGKRRVGGLVVHESVAREVVGAFRALYRARFPIRRMEPVDAYRGSDPASMAADNTSAFNCRFAVAPGPKRWSAHAYGEAIDVNPVENPYVEGTDIQPEAGRAYLGRAELRPGMAVAGGTLVSAFEAVGWSWGGGWAPAPDYQHFSATGG